MASGYKVPRRKYTKARKYNGKCENCGKLTPENEVYSYVDGDNYSISYYSPYLCKQCYEERYGGK